MVDIIIMVIIAVLFVCASYYIWRAKRNGQACIGCPNGSQCGKGCHCEEKTKS